MATIAIAGHGGSVNGLTGVSEVSTWKADITTAALDATSMASSGYEEFIAGLKGASFSLTCQGTAIPARGLSAVTLSTGAASITGSAIISQVGVNDPVDGKITYDVQGRFTGSFGIS